MIEAEYPLVLVEWVDAESEDDWIDIDEIELDLPIQKTTGYLIKQTSKAIAVAQCYDPKNESVSMVMKIPKSMIKKITPLGEISTAANEKMN